MASLPPNPWSPELKPLFDAYLQFNWGKFEYIVLDHVLQHKPPGGELDRFYQAVKLIPFDITASAAVVCGIVLKSNPDPKADESATTTVADY